MSELVVFKGFGRVLLGVFQALLPLLISFFIFQIFYLKLPASYIKNIIKGIILVLSGAALFLQGVQIGFLPAGQEIGAVLGGSPHRWLLIPAGFLLGFTTIMAEPTVRVHSIEVEKASSGYIKKNVIIYTIAAGVSIIVALAMTKVVYGIPLQYLIVPGYLLVLVLMKYTDPAFVAIAFDSGAMATGPMTVTFVTAMSVGTATVMEERSAVLDGFGLVSLVFLAPILSVMLLGLAYRWKEKKGDKNGE
ncbi:MAG: DUF1538 domain-containing protein [Firmicutes bacterium]|jgi:hypothetical protein|nr:DUF1538 domain-containing protein [Bacillota bacterium]